ARGTSSPNRISPPSRPWSPRLDSNLLRFSRIGFNEVAVARPPPPGHLQDMEARAMDRHQERHGIRLRLRKVGLLVGMALASVNIWTGSPLMALWIGSRVQTSGTTSLGAIGVVAV